MKVLVLGATGAMGLAIIEQTLEQGHNVVVYARSPEKLPEKISKDERVAVHKGGLTDEEALASALTDVHVVTSALGPSVSKGPLHPSGTPLAKAYILLLHLMREKDVKRLILLGEINIWECLCHINRAMSMVKGTASNKDDNDKFSLIFNSLVLGVDIFAHTAYKDIVAIGNTVRADPDVLWTLARVPILTSGDSTRYHAGYIGDGTTSAQLTRKAFAAFVVTELSKNEWIRKSPLISSI